MKPVTKLKKTRWLAALAVLAIAVGLSSCPTSPPSDPGNGNGDGGNGDLPGDDSLAAWSCDPPAPPSRPASFYYHKRFNFTYPTASDSFVIFNHGDGVVLGTPLVMSENGSRLAMAISMRDETPSGSNSDYRAVHVYGPDSSDPIWKYEIWGDLLEPWLIHQDMSRDGRGLVVSHGDDILFFECDDPTPKWTWNASDEIYGESYFGDRLNLGVPVHFTGNGNYILAVFPPTNDAPDDNLVKVFRRDTGAVVEEFSVTAENPIQTSISADGSRIAVSTYGEDPEDFGLTNPTPGDLYPTLADNHGRVMLYENGQLKWSKWLMHVCTGCTDESLLWLEPFNKVAISADGTTVVAGEPGGKVVKYNAQTGDIVWSYEASVEFDWRPGVKFPLHLGRINLSTDGNRVAVNTRMALGVQSPTGILYFDGDSGTPKWTTGDRIKEFVDYSPDDNPAPNGFSVDMEDNFQGLYGVPDMPSINNLWMSDDGNVLALSSGPYDHAWKDNFDTEDQNGGHLYALYHGSPVPFQYFAEDGQANRDSDLIYPVLSPNGQLLAGLASDPDLDNGHSEGKPELRIHLFEIPPGMITEVPTDLTININGDAGTITDILFDTNQAEVIRHIVKPGRAALLTEQLRLTTITGELFGDLCLPWESNKSFDYNMGDGFAFQVKTMSWETPSCITNLAQPTVMVLRSELYNSSSILLDQNYDDYIHAEVYTNQ